MKVEKPKNLLDESLRRGSLRRRAAAAGLALLVPILLGSFACSGTRSNYSDVVEMPILKEPGNLRYPMEAQLNGNEGTVRLKVFVDADGKVASARVVESSGFADLDDAAIQFASQLVFEPARRNGIPEPALIAWRVRFEIGDTSRKAMAFVTHINDLFGRIRQDPSLADTLGEDVLGEYQTFLSTSTDAVAINGFIRQVILPETDVDYAAAWSACPLRFALFDDFLRRFGESAHPQALSLLRRFAAEDIRYASGLCFSDDRQGSSRGRTFVQGILTVLSRRYPKLEINEGSRGIQ